MDNTIAEADEQDEAASNTPPLADSIGNDSVQESIPTESVSHSYGTGGELEQRREFNVGEEANCSKGGEAMPLAVDRGGENGGEEEAELEVSDMKEFEVDVEEETADENKKLSSDAEEETELVEETDIAEEKAIGSGILVEEIADVEGAMCDAKDNAEENDVSDEVSEEEAKVKTTAVSETLEDMEEETAPVSKMLEDMEEEAAAVSKTLEDKDTEEETAAASESLEDMEEETEKEIDTKIEEENTSSGGKKKGGKNSKVLIGEDVCFICFDGGDLFLCDRRGCPKAYHPACVGRDEAFFHAKGKWNCGWHLCSKCGKTAYYMCYTCPFSLCKGCTKDAVILCVRGNKGICEPCMSTVKLIESNGTENEDGTPVDFDDKSSWEYLFKDYWTELKEKLSITSEELTQAKNPWKGSDLPSTKQELPYELNDNNNDGDSGPCDLPNAEQTVTKKRKTRRQSKTAVKDEDLPKGKKAAGTRRVPMEENVEWASKELLEVVMHMRNGDKSFLRLSDIQNLLLEYIKRYNLRDSRRKSHVICDSRLQKLFGKQNVRHFEILNLLDSHILVKDDSEADDLQETFVDMEANHSAADDICDRSMKASKDKRRKKHRKGGGRGGRSNVDDYAAIDKHNINLIYLRRNLVEDLIENSSTFTDKVIGSFARIRIPGNQNQDIYRLVQVVGTTKVAEPYKVGKTTTDFLLEILNLNKTESISIDIISNQDFTEDECNRLRQSIKCGLINRLTVGEIRDKARSLQEARVKDWLDAEALRLSHLCDRASDLGRRKELRECVEKLQLLNSPEERQRKFEEIPEIHSDPNMDPDYESEDEIDKYLSSRSSSFTKRLREPVSPKRDLGSSNSWGGSRKYLSRNLSSKGLSNKVEDDVGSDMTVNANLQSLGSVSELQEPKTVSHSETGVRNSQTVLTSESSSKVVLDISSSKVVSEISSAPPSTEIAQAASQASESEKIWRYQDPHGKIQGPFSIVQLRKWNNTGYFPADLRIWMATMKQEESILLANALVGKFQKETPLTDTSSTKTQLSPSGTTAKESLNISERNLPSSAPKKEQASKIRWSPADGQPLASASMATSLSEDLQSAVMIPESVQSTHISTPRSLSKMTGVGDSSNTSIITNSAPKDDVAIPLGSTSTSQMQQRAVASDSIRIQVNTNLPPAQSSPIALLDLSKTAPSPTILNGPQSHSVSLPIRPPAFTQQDESSTASQHSASCLGAGKPAGVFPQSQLGFQPSDSWRPPVPNPSGVLAPQLPNQSWGVSLPDYQMNAPIQNPLAPPGPVNPNAGWGGPFSAATANMNWGNPNPGWVPSGQVQTPGNMYPLWVPPVQGQTTANLNPGWITPGQGPINGNHNPGWVGPGQGQARPSPGWVGPGPGQVPGNPNPGWVAPAPGQQQINGIPGWSAPGLLPPQINGNPGWSAPGHDQGPGNAVPGWTASANANSDWVPPPSQGVWGNEQNQNGARFSDQRGRGGGDCGYEGGNRRNMQSSFDNRRWK